VHAIGGLLVAAPRNLRLSGLSRVTLTNLHIGSLGAGGRPCDFTAPSTAIFARAAALLGPGTSSGRVSRAHQAGFGRWEAGKTVVFGSDWGGTFLHIRSRRARRCSRDFASLFAAIGSVPTALLFTRARTGRVFRAVETGLGRGATDEEERRQD
jgi:hypothetical protein